MKTKQINLLLLFLFCGISFCLNAQHHQYFISATDPNFGPQLEFDGESLKYLGSDKSLIDFFEKNEIYVFEKPFSNFSTPSLQRTFYMEANSPNLVVEIQENLYHIFDFSEYVGIESSEILADYPNDYGQTGPPGSNEGLDVNLGYLDYIEMPLAWDYTTGNYGISDVQIGISDGGIFENDREFENKIQLLSNSNNNKDHGSGVAAIAAAQGNNRYGITGVCQDCHIIRHGMSYPNVVDLYEAGADVINCSWGVPGYSSIFQAAINEMTADGTIFVAASHNTSSYPQGTLIYPASYDNVISVGAVGYKNELSCANIQITQDGIHHIPNVIDYVGGSIGFDDNYTCFLPLEDQVFIYPVSTAILNDQVDILGASGSIFSYGKYLLNGTIVYSQNNGFYTSHAAPQVSGTVGLMKDLNNCLSFGEVESILKITSRYIGDIPANSAYDGEYGSGGLSAGKAVQLTYNLKNPDSTAYLQNQKFSRWDFIFNGVSKNIIIQNQEFTGGSTLTVNARNVITLSEGTLLEPNSDGFVILEVDPTLTIPSDCNTFNKKVGNTNTQEKKKVIEELVYKVYPTVVDDQINIDNMISEKAIIRSISVYDISGRIVIQKNHINSPKILLTEINLSSGVYIIKGYNENSEEILTEKFIKK